MKTPYLLIDLKKIKHNARVISDLCRRKNIRLWGVTKVVCGNPLIGKAIIESGVFGLADSRISNLERLRIGGIKEELMLLRIPSLKEAEKVTSLAQVSLTSELDVIKKLSQFGEKNLSLIHI